MTDNTMIDKGNHIKRGDELTALRGIAILFVVICHFSLENDFFRNHSLSDPFFSGVELFFLISGYGIAASILSTRRRGQLSSNQKHPFLWREFVAKRCKRIYPSLFAFLIVCFFVNLIMQHMDLSDWAVNTFVRTNDEQLADSMRILTGTYIVGNHNEYVFGPIWYLSIQLQFYVVMGITAMLAWSERSKKVLIFTVSGLIAGICLICRLSLLCGNSLTNSLLVYAISWKWDIPFWGVLLYGIAGRIKKYPSFSLYFTRPLSLAFLLIPIFVLMRTGSAVSTPDENPLLAGLGYPVCILCYGLLILLCVTGQKTFLPQNSRILNYLSSRSYPLFLYNFLGLLCAWLTINQLLPWVFYTGSYIHFGIVQVVTGGFFTFALAELDYQLVEKRLFPRKRAIPISKE